MDIFGRIFPSSTILLLSLLNFFIRFHGVVAVQYSTVLIQRNDEIVCAGTLKDTETVITAANCVSSRYFKKFKVLLDASQNYVVEIKQVSKHEQMNGDRFNIALLHLASPAQKDGKTVRIKGRLPTRVYDDKLLVNEPRCVLLDPLNGKDAEVEIISNSECARRLHRNLLDEQICIFRPKGERKKCPTGIGNPVVCRIDDGSWVQVAIHLDEGCSSNNMVSTRLSHFRSWMRKNPAITNLPDTNNNGDEGTESTNTGTNNNDNEGTESTNTGTNNDGDNNNNQVIEPTDTGANNTTGNNNTNINDSNNSTSTSANGTLDNGGKDGAVTNVTESQRPCNGSEFRCADGSCIPSVNVCDGKNDCPCGVEDESSCGCNLAGTEFVTGFLNNVGPEVSILYITAPEVTRVTVFIPYLSYNETREIYQVERWSVGNTSLIISEKHAQKGVHISSDKPITVIATNSRELSYSTVDGTIVYPVNCLSTHYLVEVQNHRFYKTSQYAIIGTQEVMTNVTIVNKKGKIFSAQLGFLDTYFLQEKDLRGTTIEATDNVVVLSGSECGYVPPSMTASCDHLVNQIPPRSMFGDAYIVAQQKPRTGFFFRVQAAEDNTTVTLRLADGKNIETVTLDVGKEYVKTFLDSKPLSVRASKGVMVTQYALDAKIDDLGHGDPSMVVLPALNSFDVIYNFVVPDKFLRVSLVIYISSCQNVSGLRLNGEEVSTCEVELVSIPGYGEYHVVNVDLVSKWDTYSYATLSHIDRDVTFGVVMYGTRVEGAFAWRIGGKL